MDCNAFARVRSKLQPSKIPSSRFRNHIEVSNFIKRGDAYDFVCGIRNCYQR